MAGTLKEVKKLRPLEFTLAQEVEKKKAEPMTPHFLSLKQDMVAYSQEGKWGLKYDIKPLE